MTEIQKFAESVVTESERLESEAREALDYLVTPGEVPTPERQARIDSMLTVREGARLNAQEARNVQSRAQNDALFDRVRARQKADNLSFEEALIEISREDSRR